MVSIGEVVAELDENLRKVEEEEARTLSARENAEELRDRLAELDIHGSVRQLEVAIAKLNDRLASLTATKAKTKQAREQVQAAEYGLRGRDGGGAAAASNAAASSTSQGPQQPTAEPSGEELLSESKPKQGRLSGLVQAAMGNDDVMDSASSLSDSASSIAEAFKREFGPPIKATGSEAHVPVGPVYQAPPQQQLGAGDIAMGVLALSVVVAKGTETVSNAASRWFGKKREHKKNG